MKKNSSDFPKASPADQVDPADKVGSPDPEQDLVAGEEDGEQAALDKLQLVSAALASRRDQWVTARAAQGHDARWGLDLDQFNGRDPAARLGANMMQSVEQGYPVTQHGATTTRSTVFVQVTRQKTNAAAARLSDVVLPTDEPNFSVGPTPVSVLPSFVQTPPNQYDTLPDGVPASSGAPAQPGTQPSGAAGQGPATIGAGAMASGPGAPSAAPAGTTPTMTPLDADEQKKLADHAEAVKRGRAMQREIEDCLEEADYNAEVRKVLFDAALLGTGVLKGPVVVNRTRRVWNQDPATGAWTLDIAKELKPASFRIDPRCFFPDPLCGEHVQNGRGGFEYEKKTAKQVRDLLKQPGYITSQLKKVIAEGPQTGKAQVMQGEMEDRDLVPGEVYEHWTYWGEIDTDTLQSAGLTTEGGDDVVSACVEMINSTIVRAYLNPLPDGALPYDMMPLERVPGSVWGYGVPTLMRAQQRVINAAWRMILDNAGVSSGPQIVLKANAVKPADKQWTLTSRKIWYASDDVDDVNKAFAVFEFPSRQVELQAIIEMADKLSDQETAVPMIAQGQQGSAPETVGGTQILMQSANVMLKRQVKIVDDMITKPHMRRYYFYLMEYSPNPAIKGDFDVIALGSSALLVRDIQNQALTNLLSLGTNPAYAPLVNLKKLFEKALKAQHLAPADVMNTDAEVLAAMQQAAQNKPQDPRVIAAEARAKADEDRTAAQVHMNDAVLATKKAIADEDVQFRRENLQIEREIEMLKLSTKSNISIEQIKAALAGVAMKERTKQDMQAVDHHIMAAQGGDSVNKI